MIRKGQRFTLSGLDFKVVSVSYGRAHCVAQEPRTVTVPGRTFTAHRRIEIDISPNTDLETVEALKL